MSLTEFILSFVVVGIVTFTNTGGLGGGGIIVPVMMGLYHFDAKNAIALSNFATPWAGVVRYLAHLNLTHPLKNGNGIIVDYNLCTLMIPSAVVGASIGSIVNIMMPAPIILALFILATLAMVIQALIKYCKLLKSEKGLTSSSDVNVNNNGSLSLVTVQKASSESVLKA